MRSTLTKETVSLYVQDTVNVFDLPLHLEDVITDPYLDRAVKEVNRLGRFVQNKGQLFADSKAIRSSILRIKVTASARVVYASGANWLWALPLTIPKSEAVAMAG